LCATKFCAESAGWLQGLARRAGLLPHRGAHPDPIRRALARRVRVWKVADAVGAHALGELHRLLTGGDEAPVTGGDRVTGGAVAPAAAGDGGCGGAGAAAALGAATARGDHGNHAKGGG